MIFVFGSNLAGIHGAGAAAFAMREHGAVWKQGVGKHGNSYALPTKDHKIETLPLSVVNKHVAQFIAYAMLHPELKFKVTQIGCGLAGFTKSQIAPMFEDAPDNCYFDPEWASLLPSKGFWQK